MSARLDTIAADVAWARPASIDAALILNYSGPAFAGLDWIRQWNRPILIGFESTTTRAYGGEAAAPADAQQLLSVLRTIPGYVEGRCGTWHCVADTPDTPAWALGPITGYSRVFTLELLAGGYHPMFELPYGNRDATLAGVEGILAAGVDSDEWGVGTWGFGEGGWANAAPADSDAALVQSGNTPGPADGTDLNWMYAPLERFAAYGGPAATPARPPTIGDDDVTYIEHGNDGSTRYWKFGFGDMVEIPESVAKGELVNGYKPVPISTGEKILLGVAAKEQADAYLAGKLVSGGNIDVAQLAAELAPRLALTVDANATATVTPKG